MYVKNEDINCLFLQKSDPSVLILCFYDSTYDDPGASDSSIHLLIQAIILL